MWNQIEQSTFSARFCKIVEAKYDRFFVKAEIRPIVEYRQFLQKIRTLTRITRLRAAVHPPNPLFGRLWKSAKDYLKRRNLDELKIDERSDDKGVTTQVPKVIRGTVEPEHRASKETVDLDLSDAALLMAADGYGKASLEGHDGKRVVIVRTSEIQRSFKFDADPNPDDLYEFAREAMEDMKKERYQEHDD